MNNDISGINYLYDANGKTIAVRKGTEESKVLTGSDVQIQDGVEWLVLDSSIQLKDAKSVSDLSIKQLMSLFLKGDLTVSELEKGIKAKGGTIESVYVNDNVQNITFVVNGKTHSLKCVTSACQYQTDKVIDDSARVLLFGDITVNLNDPFAQKPQEVFNKLIYTLEDNKTTYTHQFNNTFWSAVCKAAGIDDTDDINKRAGKMSNYISSCGNNWDKLFENLVSSGNLEPSTFTEKELKQLYSEEFIKNNFYKATDSAGNILKDKNGQILYRLKHDSGIDGIYNSLEANRINPGMTIAEANMWGYNVVSTAAELKEVLNSNPNAVVVLANDIDMSGVDWIPVGTDDNPFKGQIFGNGYTIKNLTVNSKNQYSGMFGVFEGSVASLNFENCTVKDNRTDEGGIGGVGVFAGKFAGTAYNVNVKECNVEGRDNAGLLFGIIEPASNDVRENAWAYGLLPYVSDMNFERTATIRNCSASGSVKSEYSAGGIAGKFIGTDTEDNDAKNYSKIYGCNSNAQINGQVWAGGLVGQLENAFRYDYRGYNMASGKVQYEAMFLLDYCFFTGDINKDIKNPPGALGAGCAFGQIDISDKTYDLLAERAEYSNILSFNNNGVTGSAKWHIYNTYSAGSQIGWICSLNEDGSVSETKEYPQNKKRRLHAGEVGNCSNNNNDTNGIMYQEWLSHVTDSPTSPSSGGISDVALNETPGEQEQYITDPSYIDLVKQVILQNFVEYFNADNLDNPNNLVLDELDIETFLTRANYKELIDTVKSRTDLTNDELISKTIEKLLSECTKFEYEDWLISLVTALDGKVTYSRRFSSYCDDENLYVNSSSPAIFKFTVGEKTYTIALKGHTTVSDYGRVATWREPEYVLYDDLMARLKAAGASDDEIKTIIAGFYSECTSVEDKNGKDVLMYYFNPSNANSLHYVFGGFFRNTEDIIKYLKSEDDEYIHYWNTLANDENYRAEVGRIVDSECIKLYGGEYDIIPGLYTYKYFMKDENDEYIVDSGHYVYEERLRVWDPKQQKVIETDIRISDITDLNGNISIEKIKANCNDEYIVSLIQAYINRDINWLKLDDSPVRFRALSKTQEPTEDDLHTEEPELLMNLEEYVSESESQLEELRNKFGIIIKSGSKYFSNYNGIRYEYVWDPYDKKWISYETSVEETPADKLKKERAKMIVAALNMGLNFTANIKVCTDSEGSYYDYNEAAGTFVKRAK